jgi:hypothetical protein
MKIDLTSLTSFGNMTGGYGLSAITDDNQNTNCYYQGTVGYAGVVLSTPTKIDSVEIDSQANGFDASGSSTQITLSVYARTSGTPSNSTDGTLIGTLSTFMDVESFNIKIINSTDIDTEFSCVWVRIQTGVWACSTGIRIYSSEEQPPVEIPLITGKAMIAKSDNQMDLLQWNFTEINNFKTRFQLENNSIALIMFHVDVVHRGEYTGYYGALSIGFRVGYRYSETEIGLDTASITWPFNAVAGCNIDERDPAHYGQVNIFDALELPAGFYEFTVSGNSASTGSNLNGLAAVLAEGSGENIHGLNRLIIEIDPDRELIWV